MSRPKIFISYAHRDRDLASAIAQALKKADLEAWIDERSLSPGQNWIAEIEKALAEAGYLLALLSTTSLQSLWVQQEWTAMLSRQLGGEGGGIIIPLRLEDVEAPLLLRTLQRIDLFPDFHAGVASLVGFLLSETQPAVLVQQEMKTRRSVAELTPDSFPPGRAGTHAAQFSNATWQAWHDVMGHEPLTDAVLGKLDNRTIRRTALRCVTQQDLMSFCFDTNTNLGSIGGNTFNERILSLLDILLREARLEAFVCWLAEEQAACMRAAIQQYMPDLLTS